MISLPFGSDTSTPVALLDKGDIKGHTIMYKINNADLSVAICSFAIDVRSSWLVAADRLDSGVLMELPPFVEPGGVDEVREEATVLALAACLAAFSARRFCFDADGGMVVRREDRLKK